jgi:hypothetical protein
MENIGGKIVICYLFALLLLSCDTSVPLTDSGKRYFTDCGKLTISGSKFGLSRYITSFFEGSVLVQPDSLKMEFSPMFVRIGKLAFAEGGEYKKNNDSFQVNNNSVTIHFTIFSETPVSLDTVTLVILPCSYLMCNEKPLLTDTIRIRLK